MSIQLLHKSAFGLYNLVWRIAIPWLRMHQRLSEGYQQRALLQSQLPPRADLWIQAASVGESYLALEVIKALNPADSLSILVTCNTRQGIEILKRELSNNTTAKNRIQTTVRYFPFDKPSIMARAVTGIQPKLMVLLETEIWPGLLRALKEQGCKIMIINGRLTDKSLRKYLLWPSIWQALRPDKILAISPAEADRFRRLFGPDGIEVMANIKFDRISSKGPAEDNQKKLQRILPPGIPFVVLASVRREEESQVQNILHDVLHNRPETLIGLFPRHIQRIAAWQETLTQMDIQWCLRSETSDPVPAGTVLLWDTFGELMPAYCLAQSAFVGGSLAPLGGQNFLEPLVSGLIPITGPSWENFAWVGRELINAGLLREAGDWQAVAAFILKDLESRPSRTAVIDAAFEFVSARQGGTKHACRHIESILFGK